MPLKLHVIVASTRPGRVGIHVGRWFCEVAREHPAWETRLVDLKEVGLPLYDESRHPRLRDYEHEHTRRWSRIVDEADAYVLVMTEYNYGPTPALLNAFDYVSHEWAYKPAGFVSYGGISGALRAVQSVKQVLSALKVVPIPEAVLIPLVAAQVKEGVFTPNKIQEEAAPVMLDQLARWASALKPMRA